MNTEFELLYTASDASLHLTKKNQIMPMIAQQVDLNAKKFQPLSQETDDDTQDENFHIIEDGNMVNFFFKRLLICERACMFYSFMTLVFSSIYADITNSSSKLSVTMLWLIFVSTLQLITMTLLRYRLRAELEKGQFIYPYEHRIYKEPYRTNIIIEIVIILLQPYPFLNEYTFQLNNDYDRTTVDFKVNHLMCIFILCRLFIIVRPLMLQTKYLQPRAMRISRYYGFTAGYQYCIRCLFKDYPLQVISGVFMFQVFYFSIAIRVAETPISKFTDGKGSQTQIDMSQYLNCVWTVMNSMTTVGYGDYFPRSLVGRLLTCFISIWGIFSVSMLMVVLQSTFKLTPLEDKTLIVIKCLRNRFDQVQNAAFILTLLARLREGSSYGLQQEIYRLINYKKRVKLHGLALDSIQRDIKMLYEKDNFEEQMGRVFKLIREHIKTVHRNQIQLKNYVEKNFDKLLESQFE